MAESTTTLASAKPRSAPSGCRLVHVLLIGLVASGAWAQQHSVPAQASAVKESAAPLYEQEDLLFLSHMMVHHQQAVDLNALIPSRTERDELIRFARYVAGEQSAEIRQMQSLLQLAEDRGIEIPQHHLHGDPPMPGMLSSAQMAEIAAASGAEFERLWLEGMILHHQGAIDMARAQQQRQFESGRRPYGIDVLVEEIIVVQRGEISQMRSWLEQWGYSRERLAD